MTQAVPHTLKLKAQIYCGDEIAMGPGKADLLEAIQKEHSISAAGRRLGMSYRRTWMLVDTMNRCWSGPLVETATGGVRGGGAMVTELGLQVLRLYRDVESELCKVRSSATFEQMNSLLAPSPRPPSGEV